MWRKQRRGGRRRKQRVASHSRHSRYSRRLRDLPVQGRSVTINLQLGCSRCRSSDCVRQILSERVASVLIPHALQTNRLAEIRMLVGRALGARARQRLRGGQMICVLLL